MALRKMTHLPSKLIRFADEVKSAKCKVCQNDHRYFCLKCDRLQPSCVKCKECKQPRHFLCTDTECISSEAIGDSTGHFTCKYCRPVEKMTEFDDRPPPKCHQGSFTAVQLCLNDRKSERQKAMLRQKQKACPRCTAAMPVWRKCFYCCLDMEISCTADECLPKTLDLRINPHWICTECRDQHEVCPLDLENFCLSCKKDQPIQMQCEECQTHFSLNCTFPYLCYNTVKLFDKQRLCKECEEAASIGFALVDGDVCKMVENEYKLAKKKKIQEAEIKKRNEAAVVEREARERKIKLYFDWIRSGGTKG